MFKLYDKVVIVKHGTEGTIIDIRNIKGKRYIVESNDKNGIVGDSIYPIFDCSETEIKKNKIISHSL